MITCDKILNYFVVLSKAKAFGVHTNMYWIRNSYDLTPNYDWFITWKKSNLDKFSQTYDGMKSVKNFKFKKNGSNSDIFDTHLERSILSLKIWQSKLRHASNFLAFGQISQLSARH